MAELHRVMNSNPDNPLLPKIGNTYLRRVCINLCKILVMQKLSKCSAPYTR
jgi:hypothetical protein